MDPTNKMSITFRHHTRFMGQNPIEHEIRLGAFDKIIRWPCLLARVFGYWPFHRQNGLLRFKWLSTGPLFTFVTSAAIIASYVCSNIFSEKMFGSPNENKWLRQSSTEEIGQRMVLASQTMAVFFLHFAVIYSRNGVATVCNDLRATFEQVLLLEIVDAGVIANVHKRVCTALTTCFVIGIARTGILIAMVGPLPFQRLGFWEACAFAGAFALWNFLMITITAWLVVMYAGILITSAAFEILLAQGSSSSVPAFRKIYGNSKGNENVIQLGRRLRGITEDLNHHFKVPAVGTFMLMIVIMTISIFFSANEMGKGLHVFVCVLTFILYMIVFYFLCSAGEELVRHSSKYGELLGASGADGPNAFQVQYESLKMTTEPPAISPGQYFTLRSQLLSSITGVLTSYSIILVQFNTNEEQSASCQSPVSQ